MKLPESEYLAVICLPGSEKLLKDEWGERAPDFRPSYSRPGFVTFKGPAVRVRALAERPLESAFARVQGLSLGKLEPGLGPADWAQRLGIRTVHAWTQVDSKARPQQLDSPGVAGTEWNKSAVVGAWVLNFVEVKAGEFWLSAHRRANGSFSEPGGFAAIDLPPEAPSRAWLKAEEAIRLFQLPLKSGETALEFGSAPGGASWSLLSRDLKVFGVDPAEMDERVLRHPRFRHLKKPAAQLVPSDFPPAVDWIFLDMNVAPQVTVSLIERYVRRLRAKDGGLPLGVVLTLKLNELAFAQEIPAWVQRIRKLGFLDARAHQLSSNRQEVVVIGRRGSD